MTKRPSIRLAVNFDEVRALGLRPAVKVAMAAAAMDVDISTIYKLIKGGQLEAHRMGSELRVFVDSINAFQKESCAITTTANPRTSRGQRQTRQPLPAAHHEAMAYLEKAL